MEYRGIEIEEKQIVYAVFDGERQMAEFSYSVIDAQFWIRDVRLESGHEDFQTFDPVIQFIQYKCWAAGYPALYARLNMKNLFYIELYRKYGFWEIAQEETALPYGGTAFQCVMKYALPDSREESYRSYLRKQKA